MKPWLKYAFIVAATLPVLFSCVKPEEGSDDPVEDVKDVCKMMEDRNFIKFCYDYYDADLDGAVSIEEAAAVSKMDVSSQDIRSLKGIEYFYNLTELVCSKNYISQLDVSDLFKLTYLDCSINQLKLLYLHDLRRLKELNCILNQLTILNVSGCPSLNNLFCSDNELTGIDISNLSQLKALFCENNPLTTIYLATGQQVDIWGKPDNCTILYK